jgi:hypothetical protein
MNLVVYQTMKWPLIVFGVLIIAAVVAIIVIMATRKASSNNYKDMCTTDKDCNSSQKCILDKDYNRKICADKDKIECNLFPYTELVECDLNQKDGVCATCVNSPEWGCVEVSKDKPYTWSQDGKILNLPDSNPGEGWCLPPVIQKNLCNNKTSDSILIKTGDSYTWGCHCQLPNLITQDSPGDNCNSLLACGARTSDGTLLVPIPNTPSCTTNKDCPDPGQVCWTADGTTPGIGENGACFAPWLNNQDVDPRDGACQCKQGLTYSDLSDPKTGIYIKNCVSDTCAPHGKKEGGTNTCVCEPGYIRCPEDVKDLSVKQMCKANPTCIPDPCAPQGTYNLTSQSCDCGEGTWANTLANSAVGYICTDLCNPGPCGNRGTCTTSGDEPNKKAVCEDCVCPWSNTSTDTSCSTNNGKFPSRNDCYDNSQCCSDNCKKSWSPSTSSKCA